MARCHACVDVCPEQAVSVIDNQLAIQAELCIGCGSCASECPTQALRTVQPSGEDLISFVDAVADEVFGRLPDSPAAAGQAEPLLEFACEHVPESTAAARIVVPALPYVDESVIVHAAARGFNAIAMTTCNQTRCAKPTIAAVPDILETARTLLAAAGSACTVVLRRQKPAPQAEEPNAAGKHDRKRHATAAPSPSPRQARVSADTMTVGANEYSRRGMLSDMASQATTIVAETAAAEMRERLGAAKEAPNLRQTLTDGKGNMRKFPMPRMERLLDDLYALNPSPAGIVDARGFARVEVNADACRRCAMCANFCPTGALQGEAVPIGSNVFGMWDAPGFGSHADMQGISGSLTYRTSDCVGCRLCEFTCPLHCLTVHDEVDAATIFDLEPVDLLA
jgi:ferredoxin